MASYIGLGRKKATAIKDNTGLNTGNWTNVFDHQALGANPPQFEIYHFAAINVPAVSTLTVFVGNDVFSSVLLAGNSEWDPSQALPLTPDDDVYLCWNIAASGTAPVVTAWLRYDPAINPAQT